MSENYHWLLTNKELNEITNNYEFDWTLDVFQSNGIISKELAHYSIIGSRNEYVDMDCPHCGIRDKHYVLKKDEQWKCKKCKKKFSLICGTWAEWTKLEYYHWWRFAYLIGDMKITNSCVIAKDLKITQKAINTKKKVSLK